MKKALSLALAAAMAASLAAAAVLPLHLRPAPLQQRTPQLPAPLLPAARP